MGCKREDSEIVITVIFIIINCHLSARFHIIYVVDKAYLNIQINKQTIENARVSDSLYDLRMFVF